MSPHFKLTDYGFEYGAAKVDRLFHDDTGCVWIGVSSKKGECQVRITKSGKIVPIGVVPYDKNGMRVAE